MYKLISGSRKDGFIWVWKFLFTWCKVWHNGKMVYEVSIGYYSDYETCKYEKTMRIQCNGIAQQSTELLVQVQILLFSLQWYLEKILKSCGIDLDDMRVVFNANGYDWNDGIAP